MAQTLYDKYGGFPTVSVVVRAFYAKVLASELLQPYFANVEMSRLIDHQVKFFCKIMEGPDNYNGRALRAAHAHLKITDAAFDEVASLLAKTLHESGVEEKDVGTMMGVVEGVRGDIVATA